MAKRKKRRGAKSGGNASEGVGRPRQWARAVEAAAFRIIGGTQAEAARAVGVSERTLIRWESSEWWGDALKEADDQFVSDVVAFSRKTILEAVRDGNAQVALKILERRHPAFAPPNQKIELTGADGGPVEARMDLSRLTDEQFAKLKELHEAMKVDDDQKRGDRDERTNSRMEG